MAESPSYLAWDTYVSDKIDYRSFNSKALGVKLHAGLHNIYRQVQGEFVFPDNTESKTGRLVMEVMK